MSGFIIFLALLPSFAWLLFFLKEDYRRPEPKKMIIFAFLLGAAFTFLAFYFEVLADSWFKKIGIPEYSSPYFFSFSLIEEVLKFLAVFWFIRKSKFFDEPIDVMVYIITVSLGFAAVENVAAAVKTGSLAFETTTLRFIGATLLHTLSSGLLGYYWAKAMSLNKKWLLLTGFALATVLHTAFNFLIIRFEPATVPTIFLIIAALFILYDFEKLKHLR